MPGIGAADNPRVLGQAYYQDIQALLAQDDVSDEQINANKATRTSRNAHYRESRLTDILCYRYKK